MAWLFSVVVMQYCKRQLSAIDLPSIPFFFSSAEAEKLLTDCEFARVDGRVVDGRVP